jgi:hypothetical protein
MKGVGDAPEGDAPEDDAPEDDAPGDDALSVELPQALAGKHEKKQSAASTATNIFFNITRTTPYRSPECQFRSGALQIQLKTFFFLFIEIIAGTAQPPMRSSVSRT